MNTIGWFIIMIHSLCILCFRDPAIKLINSTEWSILIYLIAISFLAIGNYTLRFRIANPENKTSEKQEKQ